MGKLAAMRFRICAVFTVILAIAGGTAVAQDDTRGRVRGQTLDIGKEDTAPPPTRAPETFIDYREEMRRLVENIAVYARRNRREFVVVVQGGLALFEKALADGETMVPARKFMRSIDGVLVEGLNFGIPELDKPSDEKLRERLERLTKVVAAGGLKVLALDFASSQDTIRKALRANKKRGFVPATAAARDHFINRLPSFPRRPFDENSSNVLSLKNVRNFAYLRDSSAYGREDEFALETHKNNFDMLVVDVFHGRQPLTKRAVETLKHKRLGARRLVLAYIDVGTAESHRYYWKPNWQEGAPIWIAAQFPMNPDQYFVEYWQPEWQSIITGNTNSYIYGIIDQGYDGVVIDGLDSFRFFESGGEIAEFER